MMPLTAMGANWTTEEIGLSGAPTFFKEVGAQAPEAFACFRMRCGTPFDVEPTCKTHTLVLRTTSFMPISFRKDRVGGTTNLNFTLLRSSMHPHKEGGVPSAQSATNMIEHG